MKFIVMSRQEAEEFSRRDKPGTRSYAMISISSPGAASADLAKDPRRADLLRLVFDDVGSLADHGIVVPQAIYFDHRMADAMLDFVDRMESSDDVPVVVVHCEAGISRSRGAAIALDAIFNAGRGDLHEDQIPNMLIASTIVRRHAARTGERIYLPQAWAVKTRCPDHPDSSPEMALGDEPRSCTDCSGPLLPYERVDWLSGRVESLGHQAANSNRQKTVEGSVGEYGVPGVGRRTPETIEKEERDGQLDRRPTGGR